MTAIKILHASDLHISINKSFRSPVDKFSDLRELGKLKPWELSKLAVKTLIVFLKKMAASSYDPKLLKYLTEFIYENAKKKLDDDGSLLEDDSPNKIDAVVLTGDLATTGHLDDIKMVESFLKAPFDPRYPHLSHTHEATLSAVRIPVWYFPGNHDRFTPTRGFVWIKGLPFPKFFDPGGINYDGKFWDFHADPARVLGEVNVSTAGLPLRVVMIAADFNLKQFGDHDGIYGWLAQGKVYDKVYNDVLKVLVYKTKKLIESHKETGGGIICPLWAIHFPPSFPHIGKSSRLIDDEVLIERANECGVKAILAGHTHEQVRYRKPGMHFEVLCCGTTTQHEPFLSRQNQPIASTRNRFQIITIEANSQDDVRIDVDNYRYKRAGEDSAPFGYFYSE
jgi:predicted phosphodiesterase